MPLTLERQLPQINLPPGGLLVTREAKWVVTVLGSCVAATFHHEGSGLAAICHAILPRPRPDLDVSLTPEDEGRFVTTVIPIMMRRFHQAGIAPREITVKLFGGGNILSSRGSQPEERWVGNTNVAAARECLAQAGLRIVAEDVGGARGRKILFHTGSGKVLHKYLGHSHDRIASTHPRPHRG